MSLREYYAKCLFAKGKPLSVVRIEKEREAKKQEDKVRQQVDARDKRRCFWQGCGRPATHKHHKVYRSKGGKWATDNIVSACTRHHRWVHDGLIRVVGNPDRPPLKAELTTLGRDAKIRIPEGMVA